MKKRDWFTKKKRLCVGAITICAVCFGMVTAMGGLPQPSDWFGDRGSAKKVDGAAAAEKETQALTAAIKAAGRAPNHAAASAILIDGASGQVLFEDNADAKQYPASTTKIMTALVALEICETLEVGLDSRITVPAEAQGVEGSSLYLKTGERVTIRELLYGLMLQSGNDAAVALAACLGGDVETFVGKMNEKAEALGCRGTHFVNPNGLYDDAHYVTARDLACIARAAMQNEDFRQIVGAKKWSNADEAAQNSTAYVPVTPRTFVNKNKTVFQYDGGDGVKIGYTKASGRTLVASASRNGKRLIAVVLRDGNWFNDAYQLMDYGFTILTEQEALE